MRIIDVVRKKRDGTELTRDELALVVWPPMHDGVAHPAHVVEADGLPVEIQASCDAAHPYQSPKKSASPATYPSAHAAGTPGAAVSP